MLLLGLGRRLFDHTTGNRVDLWEWNVVKLSDVLNKRSQLKCVKVGNGHNCSLAPLVGQDLLEAERIAHIIVNVWVV